MHSGTVTLHSCHHVTGEASSRVKHGQHVMADILLVQSNAHTDAYTACSLQKPAALQPAYRMCKLLAHGAFVKCYHAELLHSTEGRTANMLTATAHYNLTLNSR